MKKENQSLDRQSIDFPLARILLNRFCTKLNEDEQCAILNHKHYELISLEDTLLLSVSEAGKAQWVYSFSKNFWFKKEDGFHYEIQTCNDMHFLKKVDDKEGKCRELYSFYHERFFKKDNGYYYEAESCPEQAILKEMDDTEGKCRKLYLFDDEFWLDSSDDLYYEVAFCANKSFAKDMDQQEGKCRGYRSLDDCLLIEANADHYFEFEEVIQKAFAKEFAADGTFQYAYCFGQTTAIAPENWIGSLPRRDFLKIPHAKFTIWYDKETNSLYDEDGVFITSLEG